MTEKRNPILTILSVIFTSLNVAGVIIFTGFMVFQLGHFVQMYMDFGVPLPVMTQLLISIPGWIFIFGGITVTALLIAKEFIPNKALTFVINLAWAILGLAVAAMTAFALFAPVQQIQESM